jgi:K+ transporter
VSDSRSRSCSLGTITRLWLISIRALPFSANLGQFSSASIRISFVFLVYPSLIFAYLGQGAQLIIDGSNVVANPFYLSIPGGSNGGLWWLTWVMGVFATVSFCLVRGRAAWDLEPLTRIPPPRLP